MATLDSLKKALRKKAESVATQPLSDAQYSNAFDIVKQSSEYQDFIVPQLRQLLEPLISSRLQISVLEIGPGPQSVLASLPIHLNDKVKKYAAFEPNALFATRLEAWFGYGAGAESPMPSLASPPDIKQTPFVLQASRIREKFDIILFCHSMYGMKPKHAFVEQALQLLAQGGMVVVFHRDESLHLDDLVCHRTLTSPPCAIRVQDQDQALDKFASFIAGFTTQELAVQFEWREVCRAMGKKEGLQPGNLLFTSRNAMVAFTQNATQLSELLVDVPLMKEKSIVKNPQARASLSATIVKPREIEHVQHCVRWALKHGFSLIVLGGGHSGQCVRRNTVSIDMGAFNAVNIITNAEDESSLVVAEAGCRTGDIIGKTMAQGLTVPLGSRPSVGAGLWLQGGIGHLARQYGLSCDSIIGAVLVSVKTGDVVCVGNVPIQRRPMDSMQSEDEDELLWAIKGAGTNFGIVISVTLKTYSAPTYVARKWIIPLGNKVGAQRQLSTFDEAVAKDLPLNASADAYLYWEADELHLGITTYESSATPPTSEVLSSTAARVRQVLGPENGSTTVDSVGLFETEMYMSGMHGGHSGSKSSSFKRCVFLKAVGTSSVADVLISAIETRPSALCYLHLLQGGGAISQVAADATAFGCRDWDFACVITGVWARDLDGTEAAEAAVQWVYNVVAALTSFSSGFYGADLGPESRDAALAFKAFGTNQRRLACLKQIWDPYQMLNHTCPLSIATKKQKLIVLVTGESCAGKDYCADVWFKMLRQEGFTARVASISDVSKREYVAATGADFDRLLRNRPYKEEHRSPLTTFFQDQVRQRPWLPQEHFLDVAYSVPEVDVLFITGMRDEAPVATLSHLVSSSKLLELRVTTTEEMRQAHGGGKSGDWKYPKHVVTQRTQRPTVSGLWAGILRTSEPSAPYEPNVAKGTSTSLIKLSKDLQTPSTAISNVEYLPDLIFSNRASGVAAAEVFAHDYLFPFIQEDLQRLANMVTSIPHFPRPGVEFRDVLDIAQQPDGLPLCIRLLHKLFVGDWRKVDKIVCCEVGGLVYGPPLAYRVGKALALVREAGKRPPPTISAAKCPSHISSLASGESGEKRIEMNCDLVSEGKPVVVVDDVLATGKTLCAVLRLLLNAGVKSEDVTVMVVAEFPFHRGREMLRQHGFGRVKVQSLLVFGGA